MATTETTDFFTQQASAAGVPTTQSELETEFQTQADAAGLTINNSSAFSPFWRFLRACATVPVLNLINWMVARVLPNLYLKTAEGNYLDIIGDGRNVARKTATKTAGVITMTRSTTGTVLPISAGQVIKTNTINGVVYRVNATAAAQFGSTDTSIQIPVEATEAGAGHNLAAGYFTALEPAITGVTATNSPDWITTPGTDDETDDNYRQRIRARFPAAASWHINAVYKSMIAEQIGIDISRIYIDHTLAPRGPGSADALVLFDAGIDAAEYLATVNDHITAQGNHGHGDDLQVKPFPETQHNITANLYADAGTSAVDMATAEQTAADIIRAAFRENSAYSVTQVSFNSRFSLANLAAEIRAQVPVLTGVEFNVWSITSGATIPRLQSLTTSISEE